MRFTKRGEEGHRSLNDDRDLRGFLERVELKSSRQRSGNRLSATPVIYVLSLSTVLIFTWLVLARN